MKKNTRHLPQHPPFWKYDFPSPNAPATRACYSPNSICRPNRVDHAYLELARSSAMVRGIGLFIGPAVIAAAVWLLIFYVKLYLELQYIVETELFLLSIGLLIFALWFSIPIIRLELELPRDEPIRFNRLTRKVYFYEFKYDRAYILSRRRWGAKVEFHDWDDLIIEACSTYAPGNGGLLERAFIAVREPGTDKVIARYFFAFNLYQAEQYWEIVRLFMKQGADALPAFTKPPRNWNNDAEVSFVRRLAPRVQWPPDMDIESRTATSSGQTQ